MVLQSLDQLPTELLLRIFKYMDIRDLCKLKRTCKRFNNVIETWGHSFIKNAKLLVTNQLHPIIVSRSARRLTPFEGLRISRNWRLGIYKEVSALRSNHIYLPWLQLEKNLLWLSREGFVRAYRRNTKGVDTKTPVHTIKGKTSADVCHFVKKSNHILSGQTDGSLWLWSIQDGKFVFDIENCHSADINSVDMSDEIMVSGSKDNYVRIWKKPKDYGSSIELHDESINLSDRVWSVALSDLDPSALAIGTAGNSYTSSLTIYDMANEKVRVKLGSDRFGAGVLDIKWDTPSVVWSCGYDASLRLWDLRTDSCEQCLEDPFESVVYCFQYDHFNSIVSGTQNNGRVVLWDIRQNNYVQMYLMDCCRRGRRHGKSSPVYGLSYDAEYLFAATDLHLSILDFSVFSGKVRDFSNLFAPMKR